MWEDLLSISQLPNLVHLSLRNSFPDRQAVSCSEQAWELLTALTRLRTLEYSNSYDDSFPSPCVSCFTNLRSLSLKYTGPMDLNLLTACCPLTHLTFLPDHEAPPPLHLSSWPAVVSLTNLVKLVLSDHCTEDPDRVLPLSKLPCLLDLVILETQFGVGTWSEVLSLQGLSRLGIIFPSSTYHYSQFDFSRISHLTNLEVLHLAECGPILEPYAHTVAIASLCSLRVLLLAGMDRLSPEGVAMWTALTNLKWLNTIGTSYPDQALPHLSTLRSLSLETCSQTRGCDPRQYAWAPFLLSFSFESHCSHQPFEGDNNWIMADIGSNTFLRRVCPSCGNSARRLKYRRSQF